MYCPYCGQKIENESVKYCPYCGAKLSKKSNNDYEDVESRKQNKYEYDDATYNQAKKIRRIARILTFFAVLLTFAAPVITILIYVSVDIFYLSNLGPLSLIILAALILNVILIIYASVNLRKGVTNGALKIIFGALFALALLEIFSISLTFSSHFVEDYRGYNSFFDNKLVTERINEKALIIQDTKFFSYMKLKDEENNQLFYDKFVSTGYFTKNEYSIFDYEYFARGNLSTKSFVTNPNSASDVIILYSEEKGAIVMLYIEIENMDDLDNYEYSFYF
ncbi:zinc ribbon domain-containing protein [bacterium]|nr:zinc ribbon domain-containing protein [bacterium]